MLRLILTALLAPLVRLPAAVLRRAERELLAAIGALLRVAALICLAFAGCAAFRNGALDGLGAVIPQAAATVDWRAEVAGIGRVLSREYPAAGHAVVAALGDADDAVAAVTAAGDALVRWLGAGALPGGAPTEPLMRTWFAPAAFLAGWFGLRRVARRFPGSRRGRGGGDSDDAGAAADGDE